MGFTALGDPLQAVYDFQLEKSRSTTTSHHVFDRLTVDFHARQVGLTKHYRARGPVAHKVVALGAELRSRPLDTHALQSIEDFTIDLTDLGSLADLAGLADRWGGSTALLCRTNADALRVSRSLSAAGVGHTLRRPAEEVGAARWIAQAFGAVSATSLDEDEAGRLIAGTPGAPDTDEAWELLKAADRDRRRRHTLSIQGLHRAVRAHALPLGLTEPTNRRLVVSTVHRAKGLEFDRVVVIRPDYIQPSDDPETQIRVQYVALSRARDDVFVAAPDKLNGFLKSEVGGRWVERTFRKRAVSVEMRTRDVETAFPIATPEFSAGRIQALLSDANIVGRDVVGWLDQAGSTRATPRYWLAVDGQRSSARRRRVSDGISPRPSVPAAMLMTGRYALPG